uniref:Uncharacterized protein n=1 Tax=viral metagenome TaxID=1070528 RepID=A0A6C0B213_9ZZZZ
MCVILYTEINGKKILAKNRDKVYKPTIEIIHEVVNDIEVAYIRDKDSGWIEGMNEHGIGMVNSTLSRRDEKELNNNKVAMLVKKNNVMYNALIHNNPKDNIFDVIKNAKTNYVLEGHTLMFKDNEMYHIENNKKNFFMVEKVNKSPVVFSNYGVQLKKEGYTTCKKGMSAFLRAEIVKRELKRNKIASLDDLSQLMNCNYKNINPRYHPYRDKFITMKKNKHVEPKKIIVSTTGQLILNMTDKELIYYTDIHNSDKVIYVNKLPREYLPKIRIIIKETEKRINQSKKIFTKRFLKSVEERFYCDDKSKIRSTKSIRSGKKYSRKQRREKIDD